MTIAALKAIRIVLVEPAGALNVGSVARVMANMGFQRLVLVNPHCDPLGPEARQMAVHAAAILEQATVVESLPAALVGCRRAIATTARSRTQGPPLERPEVALPWLVVPEADTTALIFGPEDRGLSNEELNQAQRWVGIPSDAAYASLNLAQAVAVCCYELRRGLLAPSLGNPGATWASPALGQDVAPWDQPPPVSGSLGQPPLDPALIDQARLDQAPLDQLEGFYQHLESLLLQIGYLYPHTAPSRMEKFRHFFHRAAPSQAELAMLRGILRQMDWVLGQGQRGELPPSDSR